MRVRVHIPEVLIGVLLAVAIFAMGFVVASSRQQPSDAKPKSYTTEKHEKRKLEPFTYEWFTGDPAGLAALIMLLIASGQAGLFIVQLRYMGRALVPAESAAIAAKLNAQAVIESERARLYLVMLDDAIGKSIRRAGAFDHETSRDGQLSGLPLIQYGFKNYGRTPALIEAIAYRVSIEPEFPADPKYRRIVPLPVDYVLGPGDVTKPAIKARAPHMTVGIANDILAVKTTFWFSGYIRYKDTFQRRYKLNWMWLYNGASDGFRLVHYREVEDESD